MDAAADDAEELTVDVRSHWQALVWSEDPDEVNLSGLHHDGLVVGVEVGLVADVAVARCVLVDRVPQGTGATDAVREKHLHSSLEPDVGASAP